MITADRVRAVLDAEAARLPPGQSWHILARLEMLQRIADQLTDHPPHQQELPL
jgi:hypothetical protein